MDELLPRGFLLEECDQEGPYGGSDLVSAGEARDRARRPPHSAKRGRILGLPDVTRRGLDGSEVGIHGYLWGAEPPRRGGSGGGVAGGGYVLV